MRIPCVRLYPTLRTAVHIIGPRQGRYGVPTDNTARRRADDTTETQWRRTQGGAVARTEARPTVGDPSTEARRDRPEAGTADGHRPSLG
ncbi:hypothetical protein SCMC78_58690 [Streptomyces sp. CMC78]|uniref:Uncharacterized protein n=1 Tax=Streptomyces sp. CMC78 TaxID=3231512 RepID=A0AB33KTY0_9ACTN